MNHEGPVQKTADPRASYLEIVFTQLVNAICHHGRRSLPEGKLEHDVVLTRFDKRAEFFKELVVDLNNADG